jgi:hypothetical protein
MNRTEGVYYRDYAVNDCVSRSLSVRPTSRHRTVTRKPG